MERYKNLVQALVILNNCWRAIHEGGNVPTPADNFILNASRHLRRQAQEEFDKLVCPEEEGV